jgi:hypothetical protein
MFKGFVGKSFAAWPREAQRPPGCPLQACHALRVVQPTHNSLALRAFHFHPLPIAFRSAPQPIAHLSVILLYTFQLITLNNFVPLCLWVKLRQT